MYKSLCSGVRTSTKCYVHIFSPSHDHSYFLDNCNACAPLLADYSVCHVHSSSNHGSACVHLPFHSALGPRDIIVSHFSTVDDIHIFWLVNEKASSHTPSVPERRSLWDVCRLNFLIFD